MAKTSVTIHFAVEPTVKRQLQRRAELEGLKLSDIIRRAVRNFLEAQSKEQAA